MRGVLAPTHRSGTHDRRAAASGRGAAVTPARRPLRSRRPPRPTPRSPVLTTRQAAHRLGRWGFDATGLDTWQQHELAHDIDAMIVHLGGTRVLGVLVTLDDQQGCDLVERVSRPPWCRSTTTTTASSALHSAPSSRRWAPPPRRTAAHRGSRGDGAADVNEAPATGSPEGLRAPALGGRCARTAIGHGVRLHRLAVDGHGDRQLGAVATHPHDAEDAA